MKILKYKADTHADLQSGRAVGSELVLFEIQFAPASGVEQFTRCRLALEVILWPFTPASTAWDSR